MKLQLRAAARVGRRAGMMMVGAATLALVTPVSAFSQMSGMPDMPPGAHGMSWGRTLFVLMDQLEYVPGAVGRPIEIDGLAWYGGAYNRVWVRALGEQSTRSREGEAEVQLLYGQLVDPFWDAVAGLSAERAWGTQGPRRVQLAVGLIGLVPYRFEFEPTLFVSHRGELSARLEAAYQVLITQRLVAEPEFEVNLALQSVPKYDVERGLNDYEMGVRLRYEFRRELAPYVGWSRSRRAGSEGGTGPEDRLVLGVRLWR